MAEKKSIESFVSYFNERFVSAMDSAIKAKSISNDSRKNRKSCRG